MKNKTSLTSKTWSCLSNTRSHFQCFMPAPRAAGSCSHLQLLLQGKDCALWEQSLSNCYCFSLLSSYLMRHHQTGEENSGWRPWFWHRRVWSRHTYTVREAGTNLTPSTSWPRLTQLCYHQLYCLIYTLTMLVTKSPTESASLWQIILGGTEHVSHLILCPR